MVGLATFLAVVATTWVSYNQLSKSLDSRHAHNAELISSLLSKLSGDVFLFGDDEGLVQVLKKLTTTPDVPDNGSIFALWLTDQDEVDLYYNAKSLGMTEGQDEVTKEFLKSEQINLSDSDFSEEEWRLINHESKTKWENFLDIRINIGSEEAPKYALARVMLNTLPLSTQASESLKASIIAGAIVLFVGMLLGYILAKKNC